MNRKTLLALGSLILSGTLASCAMTAPATARTQLLNEAGQTTGTATFTATPEGTRVSVQVSGLKPGMHGMHIHTNPSCTNTTDAAGKVTVFGGAGEHFDPMMAGHHLGPQASNTAGHAGDIPMLNVGADGTANTEFVSSKISLSGATSVVGRSLVIHANPDDYKTDPSGNSGARERCGVITQ